MDALPDIHDGFFDGLWRSDDKQVHLFMRTDAGLRSTIVLKEVERLNVSNFREGNIVFDVSLVEPCMLTAGHIERLYQCQNNAELVQQLLASAQQKGLSALEVNPSYGAECVALFKTLEILPSHLLPPASAQS